MILNKFIIGLVFISACMAMPEPDPEPHADVETDIHVRVKGGDGPGGRPPKCGHDSDAHCVHRMHGTGGCPCGMNYEIGHCHNPEDYICCEDIHVCGKQEQGQCYRSNATTMDSASGCPPPLFPQSTRDPSRKCDGNPDYRESCCAELPDPHCHCNHWGYGGMCGERGWYGLCPDSCDGKKYKHQSPINIEDAEVKTYVAFTFTDGTVPTDLTCKNNGHFVVCYWKAPSVVPTVTGGSLTGSYKFANLTFHIGCKDGEGSEHLVDDMSYSGELHLIYYKDTYTDYYAAVKSGASDAIATFAVFIHANDTTPDTPVFDAIHDNLVYIHNRYEEQTFPFSHKISAFLPPTGKQGYYSYKGSFTSPSCDNVVEWVVFQESISMSNIQIRPFRCLSEGHGRTMCDNHRQVQPLNGRKVLCYDQ